MGATKGRGIYLRKSLRAILFGQLPDTSTPRISPGSHSTVTSNGRQHTSQSVVKHWLGTLVSIATSDDWPQNGHWMDWQTSTCKI
jgi:hypothetical protein